LSGLAAAILAEIAAALYHGRLLGRAEGATTPAPDPEWVSLQGHVRLGGFAVQISVTGRHVEVSERVKEYAAEKAARLPRYYDRVQAVEIIIDREADQVAVEMIVRAAGTPDFVAREIGPEPTSCIDALIDKMERQLTRHKEKFRNRKHIARKTEPPTE
jgi:putative sigma-54 modulation protein